MTLRAFVWLLMGIAAGSELTSCLNEIAHRYFTQRTVLVVHWKRKLDGTREGLLREGISKPSLVDAIAGSLVKNGKWTVKVYQAEARERSGVPADRKAENVVFVMNGETSGDRERLVEELKVGRKIWWWNTVGRLIVVLRCGDGEDGEVKAGEVLRALWSFSKMCNAVVVAVQTGRPLLVYKWYPYTGDCGGIENVTLVDDWRDGRFTRGRELFGGEVTADDLNGCPLVIGAFPNPPYVLNPEGSRTNFTDGLDVKILRELSDYYNFTVRYVTLPEGEYPYIIYDANGRASGLHAMLLDQTIDVMIFGCRVHEFRNTLGDPIDSYAQDALVWVVPSPDPVPHWRNLWDAFTPAVWLAFGIFFFMSSVTLCLIANCERSAENRALRSYVSCAMASVGVIVNASVDKPRGTVLRLFFAVFSLYAINASSAYQSSLVALLARDRFEKPFETPADAVDAGVKTYLFPSGNVTYNQTDHKMWDVIFRPDRHAYSEDFACMIGEIASTKKAMVMMAQKVAGFEIKMRHTSQDNIPKAIFLKETFSLYRVTAYLSLGHPLRDRFTRKVNQLVEGGFTQHWLDQLFKLQGHFPRMYESEGARPLTLDHLLGSFYILGISLFVSCHVFIFELLVWKVQRGLKSKMS